MINNLYIELNVVLRFSTHNAIAIAIAIAIANAIAIAALRRLFVLFGVLFLACITLYNTSDHYLHVLLPKLRVGRGSCQLYFWQPNSLLAVGMRELVAYILSPIFMALTRVFGRILPKMKVGTVPANFQLWQKH